MKVQLGWLRFVVAVAAVAGVSPAVAQYAPYRPAPQTTTGYYPATGQPGTVSAGQPVTNPQPQQQPTTTGPMGQFAYQPTQQFQGQPAQQSPYAGLPTQGYASQGYAQQGSTTQGYPQGYPGYTAVAAQPAAPTAAVQVVPGQNESMPVPSGGAVSNGAPAASAMPSQGTMRANGMSMSSESMQGYPQGYPGCNNGASPYPSTSYAGGNCYGQDYGLSGYFENDNCGGSQWFGGVYFLFMERDNSSFRRTTVMADPPTDPYYPPEAVTVLSTANVDYDYRPGMEIRFGSTFTVGAGCDSTCNGYGNGYAGCNTGCGCSSPQMFAWEVALWAIDGDVDWFQVTDDDMTDTNRIYGMVNHAGLQYDDGTNTRPVNYYYDYQMPIDSNNDADPLRDYRVNSQRIRTNFRAQNVELNFIRIPVCDIGCGGGCSNGSCSTGCGNNCGSGYDACGSGYGGGCETPSCGTGGSSFSMAALCGLRYFHMSDSFEMATDNWLNGADTAYVWDVFDDIQVENHLLGFQLGVNMNYCIACKWNVFADSCFGLYNNHITNYQRVYGPNGPAQYIQEARDATINSSKDDLSFLGELRFGGSYDISCNWRAVLAYRAVAMTGVALSANQVENEFSNWAENARINSDGSVIIHGLQTGLECRY